MEIEAPEIKVKNKKIIKKENQTDPLKNISPEDDFSKKKMKNQLKTITNLKKFQNLN